MDKLILGIYLYRIFSRAYFYLPFLLIYFLSQNYSIMQLEMLMATYGVAAFLFGLYKEKICRICQIKDANKLIVSELFKIIGLILLLYPNHYYILLVAQLLLGISYSIMAGIDTSIIKNNIKEQTNIQNKSNSFMFLSLLFSGIIGSYLYGIDAKWPIYMTGIFSVLTIIIVRFTLHESIDRNVNKEVIRKRNKFLVKEKFWILHYSFLRALILGFFVGFIPINLYIDLKLNNVQFISVLTSYTIMGYISSRYLTRFLNYKFLSEICLVIFLIIYTFQSFIAITIAIIFLGISSGLTRPQTINELSNSNNLASILNYAEMLYFIFNIAFLLIGGYLYSIGTIQYLLLFMALLTFMYLLKLFYLRRDQHENQHRI
ncbi:MFS transporter [Staphylococcus argenteus]|uniref:MFS transporter n=1 Tax=Staphylococcus argenteus TaxID=985002 RepID=UPI001FB870A3|nr:MFS transporter [Staphylococcus argenteus]GJF43604.1 membrane protein [Staphylococcus argenteus]GJF58796.1 membrane protein [Staphylococcus argenteus]GJF71676.1 membrane protein [Staphylococcus argenteus]GJF84576.1 membrane protein [Staphylococcus argenteus]